MRWNSPVFGTQKQYVKWSYTQYFPETEIICHPFGTSSLVFQVQQPLGTHPCSIHPTHAKALGLYSTGLGRGRLGVTCRSAVGMHKKVTMALRFLD